MNYISVCSGIESISQAWEPMGFKPLAFSEIEPFPCAVLAHHYPDVPNLGDMTRFREWPVSLLAQCDVLVGGCPCFTAGQMVLTETGYRSIEAIRLGEMVMTHQGRLRPVLRIGSKVANTGTLAMVGNTEGIKCTSDHPFYSRKWKSQNTKRNNQYVSIKTCGDPEWTPANQMKGLQWVALNEFRTESAVVSPTERITMRQAMFMAGMYLGDGWTRGFTGKSKGAVVLGINAAKYEIFKAAFPGMNHNITDHVGKTFKVHINDTALCNWLKKEFGSGAGEKRVPAWALSHPDRDEILRGYVITDGCSKAGCITANSISRALAFGVRDLAQTLGFVGSISKVETAETTVIEGRTVNQQDYWQLRIWPSAKSRKSRTVENHLCRNAGDWTPGTCAMVYNIEVSDDNSYILDGSVVHNCQAFSVAGLGKSMADARGQLTMTFIQILNAIDEARNLSGRPPALCLYENVPGIFSKPDNPFGCLLGGLAGESEALHPPGGKWTHAGYVRGPRRGVAYRILDAQYSGLAQRRERVFVVASPGEGACPWQILFEPVGVRRDSPPSRETGKGVAGIFSARTKGGGGLGTDFELAGGLQPVTAPLTTNRYADNEGNETKLIPEVAPTLDTRAGKSGANAFATSGGLIPSYQSGIPETARCITTGEGRRQDWETCTIIACEDHAGHGAATGTDPAHPIAFPARMSGTACATAENLSPALCSANPTAVAFQERGRKGGRNVESQSELAYAITAPSGGRRQEMNIAHQVAYVPDVADTLTSGGTTPASHGKQSGSDRMPMVAYDLHGSPASSIASEADIHTPLRARQPGQMENSTTTVALSVALRGRDGGGTAELGDDVAGALRASQGGGDKAHVLSFRACGQDGFTPDDLSPPVMASRGGGTVPSVAHMIRGEGFDASEDGTGRGTPLIPSAYAVRRITCREAEKLQGFPEDWTQIPWRGKPAESCPDGPRYRAIGNSMAVPVVAWIGHRIINTTKP